MAVEAPLGVSSRVRLTGMANTHPIMKLAMPVSLTPPSPGERGGKVSLREFHTKIHLIKSDQPCFNIASNSPIGTGLLNK